MKNLYLGVSAKAVCCVLLSSALFVACNNAPKKAQESESETEYKVGSLSKKTGPQLADDLGYRNWMIEDCGNISQRWDNFHHDLVLGNIQVQGYESYNGMDASAPMNFSHACDIIIGSCGKIGLDEEAFVEDKIAAINESISNCSRSWESRYAYPISEVEFTNTVYELRKNPTRTERLCRNILQAYINYCFDIAERNVEVLDWAYDADVKSDKYIGYLVTYRINKTYTSKPYILVQLTEFDNGDSEMLIVDEKQLLSELDVVYTNE